MEDRTTSGVDAFIGVEPCFHLDRGPRRRLIAVVVAGFVPWTVVLIGKELTLVFSFGLFNTNPPELLSVYSYFIRFTSALPQFIESWGSGVLLEA